LQVDQDLRSDVARELSDISGKASELNERRIAAEDQMRRIDVRSPQDGIVYQLSVHTIGGVINPGQTIMEIVPQDDTLVVEARIDPGQIDRLQPELPTTLRFSSLGRRATPEIEGVLESISPDLVTDPKTGSSYYIARIKVPSDLRHLLGDVVLVPGMPVDVFIATGERTVLSYLVKPLLDQISHAFRER
jgi:HlyD family secretion protein